MSEDSPKEEPEKKVTREKITLIKTDGDIKKWVDDTFPYGHKRTVHVHFLDFGDPTPPRQHTGMMVGNLSKDLKTLSMYSEGVVMSCGGQKGRHDIMSRVIDKLLDDANVDDYRIDIDKSCTSRSLIIALCQPGKDRINKKIHHLLEMSKENIPDDERRKNRQIQEIRETFISHMTSLPRNSLLQKQEDATAVVCVLIDSGEDSLSTALMAIARDIPLIIMKKGDAGLDYLVALHENMKLRWERRRVGNEKRHVAVQIAGSTSTITAPSANDVSEKSRDLLEKLREHLPLITIYKPEDVKEQVKGLDAVILEALIINKKEKEMSSFLKSMMENQDSNTEQSTFINNKGMQWDYFIRSLKDGGSSAAKAFLGCLRLDCDDFHFGKLLQLYDYKNKTLIRLRKPIEQLQCLQRKATTPPEKETKARNAVKAVNRFYKARRDLYKYLGKPALYPLPCDGLNCRHCTFNLDDLKGKDNIIEAAAAGRWQTCLHPVQELFLWSLLCSNSDVTSALWEYAKDRMGAALFARAVYSGIAKRERKHKKMDISYQLKEDCRRFKLLAIWTLTSSTEMGEHKTDVLLRKPCPWWSPSFPSETPSFTCPLDWWSGSSGKDFTVLDVALQTSCKAFIAQGLPQQLMSQRWLVNQNKEALQIEDKVEDDDDDDADKDKSQPKSQTDHCCKCCRRCKGHYLFSTTARYIVCIVWQLAFILLFSYVLLMGLTGTVDWTNLALIVWVGDILVEEIRQWKSAKVKLKNRHSDCCGPVQDLCSSLRAKFVEYFHQGWNILDTFSLVIFAVGTVLAFFKNNSLAHDAGRLLLAADIVLFILRFLQVFVVFKQLGLWIIMAKKMAVDTIYFMCILLSIAYGYAMASESLLKTDNTSPDWYQVPRRAFFSIFGEFALDDFKNQNNSSSTWQWVPVYLGVFVVMTNILLLNLLIARLSSLYTKMEGKAMEYQAWQTCQAVLEFEHRSFLPPPCNILIAVWAVVLAATRVCLCSRRNRQHPSSPGAGGVCLGCHAKQHPSGTPGRGRYCCCLAMSSPGQSAVGSQAEIRVEYQMHGTCLRLSHVPSDSGNCPDATSIYVTTKTALNLTIKTQEYRLFGSRPLLLWKADPTEVREFACHSCQVHSEYPPEQRIYNQYSDLDKFEKVQAEWAITRLEKEVHID